VKARRPAIFSLEVGAIDSALQAAIRALLPMVREVVGELAGPV